MGGEIGGRGRHCGEGGTQGERLAGAVARNPWGVGEANLRECSLSAKIIL